MAKQSDITTRIDKIENALSELYKKVDFLVKSSGIDSLAEFDGSKIINKETKATVEIVGKPGCEKVYYWKSGKKVRAKIDPEASQRLGFVVAIVPRDADDRRDYEPIINLNSRDIAQYSVIIDKNRSALIRIKKGVVEFKTGKKWVKSTSPKNNPATMDLDGRNIKDGKKVKTAHSESESLA